MPYVLLILFLLSATCTVRATELDSLAMALEAIPKDSLITEEGMERSNLSVPYKFDKNKTLHIDLQKQTVKIFNEHQQLVAEGACRHVNGNTKKILLTGHWRYYHTNGQVKKEGRYIIVPYTWVDSTTVTDPATGKQITKLQKTIRKKSLRDGIWRYYSKDGVLEQEKRYY
ncbi:MAG: hypothetical protein ACK4EY_07490 [Flavipsychrobacter sp.]